MSDEDVYDEKDILNSAEKRIETRLNEQKKADPKNLINFEDVDDRSLKNLPHHAELMDTFTSTAECFLREFETTVKFRAADRSHVNRKVKKYMLAINKLIVEDIKIVTIDHNHFTDWISIYYGRMIEVIAKYEFTHPNINFELLDTYEQKDLCLYMYSRKLLEYLEGTRVDEFQKVMRAAALNILGKDLAYDLYADPETTRAYRDLHIAVRNYPKELDIHEINSDWLNKAITIKGNLVSYDDKRRVEIVRSWWICNDCGQDFDVVGSNRPVKCRMCGERAGFTERDDAFENNDYIYIKIQQHMNTDQTQIGVTDLMVKVLGNNLISYFYRRMKPAANLKLTGIVKLSSDRTNRANPNERLLQLAAIAIEVEGENTVLQYNERLLDIIRNRINPAYIEDHYRKLIRSICPHLYGQETIKKGILFQCAGAEPRVHSDSRTRVRGDLNIMLIGDSSQGKSDYGIFILKILPQSIRTIGGQSTTTKAALTTSVEIVNGIKIVTFGVLPLCDLRGIAIIDELDKRNKEDFEILSYPLDDNQTIPTHKSGFHHEVNARCPVLLIGNPSKNHGKWDPSKPIEEQTNFANWFTARVDLIFVMYDDGNLERRAAMVEHISKTRGRMIMESEYDKNYKNKTYSDLSIEKIENDFINNRFEGVYDTEYLRHELHYLKTVKPIIKPGSTSEKIVKKEWLKFSSINMQMGYEDGTVATNPMMDVRKYSTMERLAMAAARLRRHAVVQEEDVEEAVLLMTYSAATLMPTPKSDDLDKDGRSAIQRLMEGTAPMSRALKDEMHNRYKVVSRIMRGKLKAFNSALFNNGFERCNDCRGRGSIETVSGIETCMGCKGLKHFDRKFTFIDLETDIFRAKLMNHNECDRIFRQYVKAGIARPAGGQTYNLTVNTIDSVELGDFVEKLADTLATDIVREESEKNFGIPGPQRASDL